MDQSSLKSKRLELFITLCCAVLIFYSISEHFKSLFEFSYNIWIDRDLWRASRPEAQWVNGVELLYGPRTPGGFYYYLLSLLINLSRDPIILHGFFLLFHLTVFSFFTLSLIKKSKKLALFFSFFYLTTSFSLHQSFMFWNPSIAVILASLGNLFFYYFVKNNKYIFLFLSFTSVFLGAQIHAPCIIMILPLMICASFHRRFLASFLIMIGAFSLCYLHFITHPDFDLQPYLQALTISANSLTPANQTLFGYIQKINIFGILFGANLDWQPKNPFLSLHFWFVLVPFFSFIIYKLKNISFIKSKKYFSYCLMQLFFAFLVYIPFGHNLAPRRIAYLLLPAAFVLATMLFESLKLKNYWKTILVLPVIFQSYYSFSEWRSFKESDIHKFLYPELGLFLEEFIAHPDLDNNSLERNVALLQKSSNGFIFLDRIFPYLWHSSISFLIDKPSKDSSSCYFLFSKQELSKRDFTFLKDGNALVVLKEDLLKGLNITSFDSIVSLSDYLVLPYNTDNKFCFRTFNNRYALYDEEIQLQQFEDMLSSTSIIVTANKGQYLFLLDEIDFGPRPRRFSASINYNEIMKRLELHSNDLRGYNGLLRPIIYNPRLEAISSGEVIDFYPKEFSTDELLGVFPSMHEHIGSRFIQPHMTPYFVDISERIILTDYLFKYETFVNKEFVKRVIDLSKVDRVNFE